MPRRREVPKRKVQPDPKHGDRTIGRFINVIMRDGKKSTAERVFYHAMDSIEEKTGQSGLTVFKQAVANVKPILEVKSRRVGGATYQVPIEVRPERRQALAFRWIISFSRARSEEISRIRRLSCGMTPSNGLVKTKEPLPSFFSNR